MMNKDKALLIFGGLLIAYAIFAPSLNKWTPSIIPTPSVPVVNIDVKVPSDPEIKKLAEVVRDAFLDSESDTRQTDALALSGLYKDIATLISLESNNKIIVNTETIRQANILAGHMLQLDIKGKYKGLGEAAENLVSSTIGIENKSITDELREKSVACFEALSWGCLEGSK